MSFDSTMDIRPIAWAGYFTTYSGCAPTPSGVIIREFICVDPPEIDTDSLVPVIVDVDSECNDCS